MEVNDLDEDFVINLDIDPSNTPPPLDVSPYVRADGSWGTLHGVGVDSNSSAIYLLLW